MRRYRRRYVSATDTTYAPFSLKDAKGDFVGFDIDLGNEMCKRMQVKCTWVASDFDALIPSLKAKKFSMPSFRRSPLPINVSRRLLSPRVVRRRFSFDCRQRLLIQPTLDSLKGKHVGVLQGLTELKLDANQTWRSKGVDVVAYANQDLVYSDLAAGRLDAALQDEVAASEGFLKQPAGKDFAFAGSSVKDKKYFGDGTGVGLRKDDAELTAAFNKALASCVRTAPTTRWRKSISTLMSTVTDTSLGSGT